MDNKVEQLVEDTADKIAQVVTHSNPYCGGIDLYDSQVDTKTCINLAKQILSQEGLALAKEPQVICDALKCEHLKTGDDKDGSWVTCDLKTPDECPYSKEFCKGWYHCQNNNGYREVIPLKQLLESDNE